MNHSGFANLLSERNALRSMLDRIPEEAVIDRLSAEARLKKVEGAIADAGRQPPSPASGRLTFRGKPVIGGRAIFAVFGIRAISSFNETISVLAAGVLGPVAESGPIPNREQGHLLIKDIAIGSFGFEFEESCSKRHPFGDESPIATALQQTQDLLRGTVGTDDELTEAVAGLSSRAIKSARAFLEILVSADAVCALEYRDRVFGFQDVAEVRRGESRLSQENVHEETLSYSGEFQGVLPKRRTFEFKLAPDHVIRGRIGPAIENPDILNRHLHQPARISVTATRIGTGRPRLVLNALPEWSAEPSEQAM